jgi:kynurenine formamidase
MAIKPAIEILASDPNFQNSFAGFASINYRLSPYPDHPRNPSTPNDCARNAKHPDHILDVSKGLAFLESKYKISSGYLLAGHSAGATLAFQTQEFCEGVGVPIPLGVLGIDGIYALKELTINYESIPAYKQFVMNAFGPDETVWMEASPYSSEQPAAWEKVKAVILAHSEEDELLDFTQTRLMCDRAQQTPSYQRSLHFLPAKGNHDQIWKQGNELARLIKEALDLL